MDVLGVWDGDSTVVGVDVVFVLAAAAAAAAVVVVVVVDAT